MFNQRIFAWDNTAFNLQMLLTTLLDHLHNLNISPRHHAQIYFLATQSAATAKGMLEDCNVAGQAIHHKQQGTTKLLPADLIGDHLDQVCSRRRLTDLPDPTLDQSLLQNPLKLIKGYCFDANTALEILEYIPTNEQKMFANACFER